MLRFLLKNKALRRRICFELFHRYFKDFRFEIPLENGLACPIVKREDLVCFSEIFVEKEYDEFFRQLPMPKTWLDIGCNCGHFSLWLVHLLQKYQIQDYKAFMLDPDPAQTSSIESVLKRNHLEANITYLPKAVSSETGKIKFIQRDFMFSTLAKVHSDTNDAAILVDVMDEKEMLTLFDSIDLIKLDIEGAEFDFISNYRQVLHKTKYLIMEWHSWHNGGGGLQQLLDILKEESFKCIREEIKPQNPTLNPASPGMVGLVLLKNSNFSD
tara:strand:+ start:14555 stop:15364 length:810 start_codon:yes stop_codon:yes gene_type:complete